MPNLKKLIAKNLKKYGKPLGVKSATLLKQSPGVRTAGSETSGTNPTYTPHACSALIEIATMSDVPNVALIEKNDRKIGIIGGTLPSGVVPGSSDKITIIDIDGVSKTYRLIGAIEGDGVGAMFEFLARQ